MRNLLLLFGAVLLLASCSTPKYAYYFDHYDYNSGKKQSLTQTQQASQVDEVSFALPEQELIASISQEPAYLAETNEISKENAAMDEAKAVVASLSKSEKKELRKEALQTVKAYAKAIKAGENDKAAEMAKAMDKDLKLAAIFGAVGIVTAIIGGDVFWVISAVAWIIAVIFFIKWLVRQ
ncbi:MAG: hypothetical protein KF687_04330 [Cyclobacteriaceae bacterium]|nr:hypothetical protein [Cyclobacteriaceae bacterium]